MTTPNDPKTSVPKCHLCEQGFPRNDEYWQHYGTPRLGMIPNTPCKMPSPVATPSPTPAPSLIPPAAGKPTPQGQASEETGYPKVRYVPAGERRAEEQLRAKERIASLTPDHKRIRIGILCGWKTDGMGWWYNEERSHSDADIGRRMLPDYFNDLNAMHQAEKVLMKDKQLWFEYGRHLGEVTGNTHYVKYYSSSFFMAKFAHATAAQRAEAFLLAQPVSSSERSPTEREQFDPCPKCGKPIRWAESIQGLANPEHDSPQYWECLACGWSEQIPRMETKPVSSPEPQSTESVSPSPKSAAPQGSEWRVVLCEHEVSLVIPGQAPITMMRTLSMREALERIAAAHNAALAVRAREAAPEQDTARMDWLEQNPHSLAHCTWLNSHVGRCWDFQNHGAKTVEECATSLRQAIDAARKLTPADKGGEK